MRSQPWLSAAAVSNGRRWPRMNEPNHRGRVELAAALGNDASAHAAEATHQSSDAILAVRLRLARLGADLTIGPDQWEQWCAYVEAVLSQMERLIHARVKADAVTWHDSAGRESKQRLIRQIIATPTLLSEAARNLHAVLTPEQQLAGGEKLLHFHRPLLA